MSNQTSSIHIDAKGSTKTQSSPAVVKANMHGEVQKLKIWIGGGITLLITITYCIALLLGKENLTPLVGFIGLGLGYLLGNQTNS